MWERHQAAKEVLLENDTLYLQVGEPHGQESQVPNYGKAVVKHATTGMNGASQLSGARRLARCLQRGCRVQSAICNVPSFPPRCSANGAKRHPTSAGLAQACRVCKPSKGTKRKVLQRWTSLLHWRTILISYWGSRNGVGCSCFIRSNTVHAVIK